MSQRSERGRSGGAGGDGESANDPASDSARHAIEPDPSSYTAVQDALARCRHYRKENGLYAVVEPALGRIVLEIGPVGAITVPTPLGERMREFLAVRGRSGPIIGHPRSARWTFLTEHADDSIRDMTVLADMFHQCAALAQPGTQIVLPSPADERAAYRIWIDAPAGRFRPDLAEVVAAVQACRPTASA